MNSLVMTIVWYGQPDIVETITDTINNIFVFVFTIEAIIKIIGFGNRYFKDNWNVFDFVIFIGSAIGIILSYSIKLEIGSSTTIVRSLRIVRTFKLFRKQKSLQIIFETFITTLPVLLNVGGLLLLFIFIYSILGLNLFANVKLNGLLNEQMNF